MVLPGADFPIKDNVRLAASSVIYWVTPSQINAAGLEESKTVPAKIVSTLCLSKSIGTKVTCSGDLPKYRWIFFTLSS